MHDLHGERKAWEGSVSAERALIHERPVSGMPALVLYAKRIDLSGCFFEELFLFTYEYRISTLIWYQ